MTGLLRSATGICYQHFGSIGHRRRLAFFLILLPILLMTIFGVALGDQRLPPEVGISSLPHIQEVQTVLKILNEYRTGRFTSNDTLLVGTFKSPPNCESNCELTTVYVLTGNDTSIVALRGGTYYFVELAGSSVMSFKFGAVSDANSLPEPLSSTPISLVPLYSNVKAMDIVRVAAKYIGFAMSLASDTGPRFLDYLFPDIVGIEIIWSGVLGASVMATEDRVSGARKRILLTPIPRAGFLLGNAMANFMLVGTQLVILFVIAFAAFHVRIIGNLVDLGIVAAVASFSTVGIGLIISHFSKSADEAFYSSTLVNLPMSFLSTTLIPKPEGSASFIISQAFPLTYANTAMQDIAVNGSPLSAVYPQIIMLIIFGLVLYGLGTLLIRREK